VVALTGKVAIVIGGGSAAGRATSMRFAALGACVVVADPDGAMAESAAREITQQGGRALAIRADATNAADNRAAVELAVSAYGGLDVLVATADIAPEPTPFEELPEEEFHQAFAVNVLGPWLAARAAAPELRRRGGGAIVIVGSVIGERPRPGFAAYAAAKAAANQLAKALSLELASDQIRVNCVAPMAGDTPVSSIPLGRPATAEDVAEAAVYFASDEAAFLTGVVLPVDGGRGI
jgi:3-oxoacyl-[acyl-carrier protein] reductase